MSFVEQTHLRQSNMLSIPALPDSFNEGHQEAEEQPSMVSEHIPDTSSPGPVSSPFAAPTMPSEAQPIQPTPPTTPAAAAAIAAATAQAVSTPSSKISSPHKSRLRQPQHRKKATASRDQHSRLPTSKSSSVFDRLYKTQTVASKAWTPARAQARKTNASNRKVVGVDDTLKVFSRLHITGTVANASKRVQQRHPSAIGRYTPEKNNMFTPEKAHSLRSPAKTPSQRMSTSKSPRKNYVYSPRMKPITKLYFDSRYHPGLGVETIEPIKLGYSFFQAFCEYENGGMDSRQLAREIILAFFKKDFPAGRHWEMQEPVVEERPGEQHSYNVKMSATYDWQDGYRVASAKGIVRCQVQKREVRVKNYIYDVTGL